MMMYGALPSGLCLPIQFENPSVIFDGRLRANSTYDSDPLHFICSLKLQPRGCISELECN